MATIVHQLRGSSPEGRVRPAAKGVCRMRAGHAEELLSHLTQPLIRRGCLTHVERRPARPGRQGTFPTWSDPRLIEHLAERSEEHTSELQSRGHLVCRLLLEK